ncbi:MAG: hypothetical protein Q9227_006975 [Pyrenula ochraceoflavens]
MSSSRATTPNSSSRNSPLSRNPSTQPSSPPDATDMKSHDELPQEKDQQQNQRTQKSEETKSEDVYVPPRMPETMQKLQSTSDFYAAFISDKFQENMQEGFTGGKGGHAMQEALQQEATKFDTNPESLGAHDLVASQQPKLVKGKMRNYQLQGLEWLKTLFMNGLNGILADEMGLGKTIQAISLIAHLKEQGVTGPFLVIAPLTTLNNWVDEFARWTPSIKTAYYHGSKQERQDMRQKQMDLRSQKKMDFPVVCTSYQICMNDKKFLDKYQWKYIIVDEAHRLKNMESVLVQCLKNFESLNRLLLTGTPLQNNIEELWSLLNFLLPQLFENVNDFKAWFDFSDVIDSKDKDAATKAQTRKLVSAIHAVLKPFLLRRIKTDVETELPKKREYVLYARLTAEQSDLYNAILRGDPRKYLEDQALNRIESKMRTTSLKRKAGDSGLSTPDCKSVKTSRSSTPASTTAGSGRRGRPSARKQNYTEVTDADFDAKLRMLDDGEEVDLNNNDSGESTPSDDFEEEELERAANLAAAKKEIANKKLQNPVMQARLACNSPHNFYWPWSEADESDVDESLCKASGKLQLLDRLLPALFKEGHKVLVFSQFKSTLDILEVYSRQLRGWNTCRIDGSIPQSERQEAIQAFNTDKSFKMFLLSTRAGGQGINLVAADTVILFDSDWNPQQDLQAMDRAHRIGQKKPVIVYRLATRNTVEQGLLDKAGAKRRLEKIVIQKGKFGSLLAGITKSGKVQDASEEDVGAFLFGDDDGEKYHGKDEAEVLSDADLKILTDRSAAAYERAEKGVDVGGRDAAFQVTAATKEE